MFLKIFFRDVLHLLLAGLEGPHDGVRPQHGAPELLGVPHALLGVLLLLLWVPGLLGVLLLPLVLLGVLLGVLLLWMGTGLLLWVGTGLLLGMRALGLLGVGALGLVLLLGVLARLLGVPCCLLLLGVASRLLLGVLGLLVALGQLVLAPRVLPDQHLPHPLALALVRW